MQAPPTPSHVRGRIAASMFIGAGVATALLTACAGKKPQQIVHAEPAPPSALTPSVHGSENGMEMMWWGVSAGSQTLAELLAPYITDDSGLDPRTRALWQTNGIRLVAVPIDRLDAIRHLLRQTGGVQRQWLGQVPLWTDVIHGSSWHDLQAVDMDNGRLTLGPGRLRILLRCWTMPVPALRPDEGIAVRAAMRAEMLIQHEEPPRIDAASLYARPTDVSDPLQQGLVFDRLAAAVTLPPDRALLVVPEAPQIDWRSLAQIPPEQLAQDEALLAETRARSNRPPPAEEEWSEAGARVGQVWRDRGSNQDRPEEPVEPEIPGPVDASAQFARTLGELLLSPNRVQFGAKITDRPAIRSVLVLVPRIPRSYTASAPASPPSSPHDAELPPDHLLE